MLFPSNSSGSEAAGVAGAGCEVCLPAGLFQFQSRDAGPKSTEAWAAVPQGVGGRLGKFRIAGIL